MNRFGIEWHKKYTFALACLIFLFIGAPLGAIIRKGGLGMPLVISVLLFIFTGLLPQPVKNSPAKALLQFGKVYGSHHLFFFLPEFY